MSNLVEFEREGVKHSWEIPSLDRALLIRGLIKNRYRCDKVECNVTHRPNIMNEEYQRINQMRLDHGLVDNVEADDTPDESPRLLRFLKKAGLAETA